MPSAHAVLWFMGTFIGLWAMTLIYRGLRGDRNRGRRRCPACRGAVPESAGLQCPGCGFEGRAERQMRAGRRSWPMALSGAGLVLAAIGVLGAGEGVRQWSTMTGESPELDISLPTAAGFGVLAFGFLVLTTGIRGDRSRGRRRCPKCWYDMAGVATLTCPECGHTPRHASGLYRPLRRWKLAGTGAAIMLGSLALFGAPRYQRGGPVALVPTTVLIAGLAWLPDSLIEDTQQTGTYEDWTLDGRMYDLWEWQRAWLQRRAGSLARSSEDPAALLRALYFLDPEQDVSAAHAAQRRIARMFLEQPSERNTIASSINDQRFWEVPPDMADLAPHVPSLRQIIRDGPDDVAIAAMWLVAATGRHAAAAAPELVEALDNPRRRKPAFWVLRGGAFELPGFAEALLKQLDHADPEVRWIAASLLGRAEFGRPEVVERLLAMLADPDEHAAVVAARALGRIGAQPDRVIPTVLAQARSSRQRRADFLDALPSFGVALDPYLHDLSLMLEDSSADVRAATARAFGDLAYELESDGTNALDLAPVADRLRSLLLTEPEEDVRDAIIDALSWLPDPASEPPPPGDD